MCHIDAIDSGTAFYPPLRSQPPGPTRLSPCPDERNTWSRHAADVLPPASWQPINWFDDETTLRYVTRLAVPDLADWCLVYVLDDTRPVPWLVVAHANRTTEQALIEHYRCHGSALPASHPLQRVAQTGGTVVVFGGGTDWLPLATGDTHHDELDEAEEGGSAVVVPVAERGRTLGAIALGSAWRPGRTHLAVAKALASLCGLALAHARLYGASQACLAAAAHDLKDPLTSISGIAQILERKVSQASVSNATLQQGLSQIDATARRAALMLDEMLDTSSVDVGEPIVLRQQPTDLTALVRRAVDERQQLTQRHALVLEATPGVVGQWDVVGLERMLANLLGNAIKYSPAGGTITVSLAPEGEAAPSRWAVLSVRDEGLGIPAADLPHIFEQFHRGTNVAGRITGTGLGLATVWRIVEQHGGSVSVHSREGAGTTIVVRLPLSQDRAA